jgi:hypothetical protein
VSAMHVVLLMVAVFAVFVGFAGLSAARGLRREVSALRSDLVAARAAAAAVPATRASAGSDTAAIRAAVADALADERERELSEARAFWAAQEARGASDASLYGSGGSVGVLPGAEHSDYEVLPFEPQPFLPRQSDLAGCEPPAPLSPLPPQPPVAPAGTGFHHPSNPDFVPSPVVANQEQTAARLAELAEGRIPLTDVRPGPLGTLDVYVFADGTTLCLTPGHRDTAERLCDALDRGGAPVLLGGSALAGAYALTFTFGTETLYILADRVVTSL